MSTTAVSKPARPSKPVASPSTPEGRMAGRAREVCGESLIESYRARIADLDRAMEHTHPDPYQAAGRMPGFVRSWRAARSERHTLADRLAWLLQGRDEPFVPPDAAIGDAATAADLLRLYVRSVSPSSGCPVRRLLDAASRAIARAAGELKAARRELTDEVIARLPDADDPIGAWDALIAGQLREAELTARLAALETAVAKLPTTLARHVSAAIDAHDGGARGIASGLAQAASPAGLPPLDRDPIVMALENDLAAARRSVADLEVTAARGGATEGRLDALRAEMLGPIAARIDARRDRLRADREAAVAGAVDARMPTVEAARSGNIEAVCTLRGVARAHPDAFPDGFAERLSDATAEAVVEAGTVLAQLLESA